MRVTQDVFRLQEQRYRTDAFGDERTLRAMPIEGAGMGAMQQEVWTAWDPDTGDSLSIFLLGISTLDAEATLAPGG